MRTADQIKRKLHQLSAQKQSLETRLAEAPGGGEPELRLLLDRIEDQVLLLEWVLNEPSGKYHG